MDQISRLGRLLGPILLVWAVAHFGFRFLVLRFSDYWSVGGGVAHMIFHGGNTTPDHHHATRLFALYVFVACLLTLVLVLSTGVHWAIIAVLASGQACWFWWLIADYVTNVDDRRLFHLLLAGIPAAALLVGWGARWMSMQWRV